MYYGLLVVAFFLDFEMVLSSFCGDSAIPYYFEVLENGNSVLGCARPSCFGRREDGRPLRKNAVFYRWKNFTDGFVSPDGRESTGFPRRNSSVFRPQLAECEATYSSDSCEGGLLWVGGIHFSTNPADKLLLRCCAYKGLTLSRERGAALLKNHQKVIGGEVVSRARPYAFDYISNVEKFLGDDGSVKFKVHFRRFPCLPPPKESAIRVEEASSEEIRTALELSTKSRKKNAKAFQAPTVQVGSGSAAGQGGGAAGSGGGFFCFSGDTVVRTSDGGSQRLDELDTDMWILTAKERQIVYTNIERWLHRMPDQLALFHRITLSDGTVLKITGKHFIYKTDCDELFNDDEFLGRKAVWAEEVAEGDCLYRIDENENGFTKMRVTNVSRVFERGIYAPMTATGDIIVNGILSSCHNVIYNLPLQNLFFQVMKEFSDMTAWWFGNDYFASPEVSLPPGMATIGNVIELVLPTDLHIF